VLSLPLRISATLPRLEFWATVIVRLFRVHKEKLWRTCDCSLIAIDWMICHLLKRLDLIRRSMDQSGVLTGLDRIQQQTFDTIVGGVAEAFDLSREHPETIARYDTASMLRPDGINRRWNNHKSYVDNVHSLGKLLLLARRLCEAGCGFVTVTTNFVWDMHSVTVRRSALPRTGR
jgi:hypothetical protein